MKLRNGRVFSLKAKPEPPATVYFGVRFRGDGINSVPPVFMPRKIGKRSRDFGELRRYALRVRGFDPKKDDSKIVNVAEACVKCARSIPGCKGCAFSAAIAAEMKSPPAPAKSADAVNRKPEQSGQGGINSAGTKE